MKDIINATENLSKEVNQMYDTNTKDLFVLVKKQSEEIDRRGQIVMKMDESIRLQQQNIQSLQEQNRHLEAMIEDLKTERLKLLEEIKDLKESKKRVVKSRIKKVETVADNTEAA